MKYDNVRMIIMQGASGSGKSTYAEGIKSMSKDWEIVSRDSIRAQYMTQDQLNSYFKNGQDWSFEEFITKIEYEKIARILGAGKKVIVDNTNLRKKYVKEYVKLAIDFDIHEDEVTMISIPVSLQDAIARVKARGERNVSEKRINSQIETLKGASWTIGECFAELEGYIPKTWFVPPFPVEADTHNNCKNALICDLDGTLAHRKLETYPYPHLRSFYDYDAAEHDDFSPLVREVLIAMKVARGIKIIFVSGRKNDSEKATVKFLKNIGLDDDYLLFMRDPSIDSHDGKDDPDDVVKYRLFNENIRGKFNIIGVIDDRKRVLALWEALGLEVMNVGKLNEVF